MKVITVESVLPAHPDKVCDAIADQLLDKYLECDANARVAIEVLGTGHTLLIGGEVASKENFTEEQIQKYASEILKESGSSPITEWIIRIHQQSPEINKLSRVGAGDSGIMYGYATSETDNSMPYAINIVHKKAREYFEQYGGDGKVQLTFDGRTIISEVSKIQGRDFKLGGFEADTGLTGRKLQVDTYCGLVPHGGGALSGKDPTKVDRSAAYMARFAAKNIVAAGHAKKCLVSVAYAIGRAEPLMIEAVDENGKSLAEFIKKRFDFRPAAIIERLNLSRPIYLQTASYGHFGRPGFPWEEITA